MIMTDNDYDRAIVWCKKKIENVKKYHILNGKRLEGYEEAMLCVMSYLHCEKERLADNRRAVEMVRCRECKYWGDADGKLQHSDGVLFARCKVHNYLIDGRHTGWCPTENDFCSYGKRKGGSDND